MLGGDYPRRDDDRTASTSADVKAAAESYREAFAESQDPLMSLLRRFGDGASGVGDWVGTGAGPVRKGLDAAWRPTARPAAALTAAYDRLT